MVLMLNEETFKTEVMESKLPVIVDFWASWCGPCKMLGPIFEEVSKEYEGKLKFGKLSTEEHPNLAQHHHITGIPCMIIFHKGQEVDRIVGLAPAPMLKERINAVLAKIEE